MSVLLSQGGRVGEIKGYGRPRMRPKLIKQCRTFAAPALVKHSFSRKVSALGVIRASLRAVVLDVRSLRLWRERVL